MTIAAPTHITTKTSANCGPCPPVASSLTPASAYDINRKAPMYETSADCDTDTTFWKLLCWRNTFQHLRNKDAGRDLKSCHCYNSYRNTCNQANFKQHRHSLTRHSPQTFLQRVSLTANSHNTRSHHTHFYFSWIPVTFVIWSKESSKIPAYANNQ